MRMRDFVVVLLALGLFATGPACAQKRTASPARGDDFSLPAETGGRFEVSSENIFGFTDGTDTNSQGEREFSFGMDGRFGKRVLMPASGGPGGSGPYRVLAPHIGFQYGVTDDFSVETTLFGDSRHIRHVPDIDDNSKSRFDGGSVQLKYRLLERTRDNRFGLSVSFEPRYARISDQEGRRQDSFGGETRLLFDMRIVDGLLWYGANLAYEPQVGRFLDTRLVERQSGISASQGLTARVLENTYLGAEMRYSRAYDGLALKTFKGQGLFAGPTFYHQFSKSLSLAAAWQVQVWGRAASVTGPRLDLDNFERHYARIKIGVQF